ncbi:MAG: chemotaxis protein CheW [Planctomycetaceae bacterium]
MPHTIGILRCQLSDEAYGFEMSSVASVRHASAMLRPTEAAPREPVGWVAAPGESDIPVYRLADCLNRPVVGTASRQHVVVVNSNLGPQGYLVEAVSRVNSIPAERVHVCPEVLNDPTRRLFQSVVLFRQAGHSDSMCLVLTPDRLHRRAVPLNGFGARGDVCPMVPTLGSHGRQTLGFLPTTSLSPRSLCEPNAVVSGNSPSAVHPPRPVASAIGSQSDCHWANAAPLAKGCESHTERIVLFPLTNTPIDGHELLCGLSATQVAEILEPLPIIPVPFAPSHVAGFVIWREQAVPVLQLGLSLGVTDAVATSRMMIVRQGREFLALMTSQVLRARRLPLPHQPCSPPLGLDSAAILGTFQSDSETLVVLNVSRLTRPQSLGV